MKAEVIHADELSASTEGVWTTASDLGWDGVEWPLDVWLCSRPVNGERVAYHRVAEARDVLKHITAVIYRSAAGHRPQLIVYNR